jgi:hypothetical protein
VANYTANTQFPSIQAAKDVPAQQPMEFGKIAGEYVKFADYSRIVDKTHGIPENSGKFHTGNTQVTFDSDNITVGDKTYTGTSGLWELFVSNGPNLYTYTINDKQDYEEIFFIFFLKTCV